MMEELHELLGGAGALTLSAVAVLGMTIYLYPRLRHGLPVPRTLLALLHGWGAVLLLPLALGHYLLAPRVHPLQLLGALGLPAAFVLGHVLRRNKRLFLPLVQAKAILTLVSAMALVAGHLLVEDGRHEREGTILSHRAVPVDPQTPIALPSVRLDCSQRCSPHSV